MSPATSPDGAFPATRWSQVVAAGAQHTSALEELCRSYWYPLYVHARRRGHAATDADDLVQGFILHLLARNALAVAQPERGRFRNFLLTAFRNFLADAHDHAVAAKRDRNRLVWIDGLDAEARYRLEPVAVPEPDREFDRQWALSVLAATVRELEADYVARGQGAVFTALRPALLGATETPAETAGLSPGAAKVALHRLRQRWGERLRARVRETVADEAAVDTEVELLITALRNVGPDGG